MGYMSFSMKTQMIRSTETTITMTTFEWFRTRENRKKVFVSFKISFRTFQLNLSISNS